MGSGSQGFAVALCLAVVGLAGCVANTEEPMPGQVDEDQDATPVVRPEVPTGGATVVVGGQDAEDQCQRPASTVKVNENATFTGSAHAHDYWDSDTERLIFDATAQGVSGGWVPVPGAVVLQGTGLVRFELEWLDPAPMLPTSRTLQWDMPGDERYTTNMFSHTFTSSGEVHEFNISIENNDPPHYDRTTWSFKIDDEAHFRWTIFRTYECLPIDSPHYDSWLGETEMLIHEDTTTHSTTEVQMGVTSSASGRYYGFGLEKPNLVPEATERLEVEMQWNAQGQASQFPLSLEYCPGGRASCGSTSNAVWIVGTEYEEPAANKRIYQVPVAPEDWDSPYASTSGWKFRFVIDTPSQTQAEGSGNFQGTIDWKITAFKISGA